MIVKDFREHNTIVEKYDVERRTSQLGAGIKYGYETNVIGFGWTNAAFTELYAELPEREKPKVLKLAGMQSPGVKQNESNRDGKEKGEAHLSFSLSCNEPRLDQLIVRLRT